MKSIRFLRMLAGVAMVFGALTILSGGMALFGGAPAQAAVGNAVGFVLWFNFLAGFAYVATGLGLWLGRRWSVWAAALLVATTGVVAIAFAAHVMGGAAFEMRTVGAMAIRVGFWLLVAVSAWRTLVRN